MAQATLVKSQWCAVINNCNGKREAKRCSICGIDTGAGTRMSVINIPTLELQVTNENYGTSLAAKLDSSRLFAFLSLPGKT